VPEVTVENAENVGFSLLSNSARARMAARGGILRPCGNAPENPAVLPEIEMDAGDADRRWYLEIERRLAQRFHGVYATISVAGLCGIALLQSDGVLRWLFGVPAALLTGVAIALGVRVLREHDARRALVRSGERVALQAPRIGHRSVVLPTGTAGTRRVQLWRLEGRVFDAARGVYVDCASDWQQPPPPVLDPAQVPPLLVDRTHPSRRWLPVGALRTAGYA
jgi:hypothetical protein